MFKKKTFRWVSHTSCQEKLEHLRNFWKVSSKARESASLLGKKNDGQIVGGPVRSIKSTGAH